MSDISVSFFSVCVFFFFSFSQPKRVKVRKIKRRGKDAKEPMFFTTSFAFCTLAWATNLEHYVDLFFLAKNERKRKEAVGFLRCLAL